jgi:hypothetical protein
VIENGQPDAEQLQSHHERKTAQQLDLLGVGGRTPRGKSVGDEMLDQEKPHRNDARERLQAAQQKGISLARPQRSDTRLN